jgi:hypothetical protein
LSLRKASAPDTAQTVTGGREFERPAGQLDSKLITAPKRASTLAAARHDALLDACWSASGIHAAATPAVLIDFLIRHVRERPDYDALRLERLELWLVALRARQADDGELLVGRAAINAMIDRVVDTFDGATLINRNQIPAKAG